MTPTPELKRLAEEATDGPWTHEDLERFAAKTRRADNGCLIWTAATSGRPGRKYGCFYAAGKPIKAHRFALLLKQGFLTPGLMACHTCDERLCVEPSHIYEGTASDNVRDAVERGQHSNGQSLKSHCPQGHPYEDWNTYEYRGTRNCRICRNVHRGRDPMQGITANPARVLHLIEENERLREAVTFYADERRYNGPNQRRAGWPDDPFTGDDESYTRDVTRDGGEIARQALGGQSHE